MTKRINIKGPIVPNNYKWFYDWFEEDSTCPNDVEKVLNEANGEDVEVFINSSGGIVDIGSEIYTMLRSYEGDVKIYIVGEACSAASVIAMSRYSEMSPTALMMVHCVSSEMAGNHNDMEHMAEVLKTADEAIASAYMEKSGMSKQEVLDMMEHETWLTAEQAKEKGLIDGIMFENKAEPVQFVASVFNLPTQSQMERVKQLIEKQEANNEFALLTAKLNFLKLKGDLKDE